ncbi:SDR family oxidoreductase [Sphingobium subterraneum]|uniref:NAD(P)-dependent dehydrogenase (Short-subunit alcohol dehydrogenase family) n=1 Tax=Sphingobium subterraneum TaxID=627688 RepID=A0A841J3L3_9SPHN|nr:NAD(P)-dependent dehydrogenase (short-subunit alcohol dehydrogenase family) [Sphingobium subterraneum]
MKLALVTGGHRRLGAAIAAALARAGYSLAIHGSHDVELDPVLEEALRETGTRWHGFVADFADPAISPSLMAEVRAHFGALPTLLVNSAAMFGQDLIETVSADDLLRHYTVNCVAPVLLTRAFADMSGGGGDGRSIVNILDQRLAQPHGDQLAYTLSKQALAGFTQIAARELAPRGIRVNAVAPGLTIATPDYDAAKMQRLAGMMPLQALPQPEEIAQAVLYLADAASVTGQVIAVDRGAHLESYSRDFMHL